MRSQDGVRAVKAMEIPLAENPSTFPDEDNCNLYLLMSSTPF